MRLDYFIIGHLYRGGRAVCTCIAGREDGPGGRPRYWNMRGGLEYMRNVEIYPCHPWPSLEAMQDNERYLYKANPWDKPGEELIFKACDPQPVTL